MTSGLAEQKLHLLWWILHAAGGADVARAQSGLQSQCELESEPLTTIRDKSVLITGAGRGVGKRLAMGFAQAGARVGLLARSQTELDLAKMEIEQAGGIALRLRAYVRDLEQMTAAVDKAFGLKPM